MSEAISQNERRRLLQFYRCVLVGPASKGNLTSARPLEYFWLCDRCRSTLTLIFDPATGIRVIPADRRLPGTTRFPRSASAETKIFAASDGAHNCGIKSSLRHLRHHEALLRSVVFRTEDSGMDRLKVWVGTGTPAMPSKSIACAVAITHENSFSTGMRTGCLQYPFTATLRARQWPQKQAPERETLSPSELQPLAEVIVDRDSIERILTDNPLSLNTLLDELMMVLEKEVGDGRQDEFDCEYWMPTGR